MRITNSMMIDRVLTNLNTGMLKNNKHYQQLSTNRKINRLSDDPVGVLSSMQARLNISTLNRYQESVTQARTWVDLSESSLMDTQSMLQNIKENLTGVCSVNNPEDKQNVGVLIEELVGQIEQNMNATVNGKYLFAGYNTTNVPFVRDANGNMLYNGIDLSDAAADVSTEETQRLEFEIGVGLKMEVAFTGIDIVGRGEDNMFKVLDDLVELLQNGADTGELTPYIDKVETLRENVTTKLVECGARTNKLDLMENRYSADAVNYEAVRTNIEDIDAAEVIMQMKFSESIYQQALSVGARIIQPTLLDFLN